MKKNQLLIIAGLLIVLIIGYIVFQFGSSTVDDIHAPEHAHPDVAVESEDYYDRQFHNLSSDRQELLVVREFQEDEETQIVGGILPEPYSGNDFVVMYLETDGEWWIQPDSENYFHEVQPDGYFQLSADPGDNIILYVVSTIDIDFPMMIPTESDLPPADGIFIMNEFRRSLDSTIQ